MHCFSVNKWEGEPEPDNEVEKLMWVSTKDLGTIKIGSIFEHEVIP